MQVRLLSPALVGYEPKDNAAYLAARYADQRESFFHYLGGRRCAVCGTSAEDVKYEIDHMNARDKSFPVARLWPTKKLPEVYGELEKCQVLCAPCHLRKTAAENRDRPAGFSHGTVYGWMKRKCRCDECDANRLAWHAARNAARRKVSAAIRSGR